MERRGCERKTCCIRDKPGCCRLRSMSVPMEEREETDDHGPQGYRRSYSERNERSQQDDRQADGLLDENDLQTRALRCKAAQHRCDEGCRPHHNGTATGEHTP